MFVQIVKFKLKPGTSRESFIGLTEKMIAWLKSRTGFIAYELYEGPACWSDRIAWEDQKSAEDGLQEFLTTDIAQQIILLVEDGYSRFFGQVVVSVQGK